MTLECPGDKPPQVGVADDFLQTATLGLRLIDAQQLARCLVQADDAFLIVDGQHPFDHARQNGPLLVVLPDDRADPLLQLLRHLIEGFGQAGQFVGVGHDQAEAEFAAGKTLGGLPHLFQRLSPAAPDRKIQSAARPAATTPVQISRFSNCEIARSTLGQRFEPRPPRPITARRARSARPPTANAAGRSTDSGSRCHLLPSSACRTSRSIEPAARRRRGRRALSNSTWPARATSATNRSLAAASVAGAIAGSSAAGELGAGRAANARPTSASFGVEMVAQGSERQHLELDGWQTTPRPPRPATPARQTRGKAVPTAGVWASLLLEAVADSADRFDAGSQRTELLAQAHHLHVDRPLGDRVVLAFDGVDDLAPREGPARLTGQEVQQAELGKRQIDRRAVDQYLVAARVNQQVA